LEYKKEVGSQMPEIRSQRSEVRSMKSENKKSEIVVSIGKQVFPISDL